MPIFNILFSIIAVSVASVFCYLILIGASLSEIRSFSLFFESVALLAATSLVVFEHRKPNFIYGSMLPGYLTAGLLLFAVGVQIVLFVHKIALPPIWSDEFVTYLTSRSGTLPFPTFPSWYHSTAGIAYSYATYFLHSFEEFRYLSYAAYLFTAGLIYWACRAMLDRNVAILAVSIFLVTPNFYELAFYVRGYMLSNAVLFAFVFAYLARSSAGHLRTWEYPVFALGLAVTLSLHLQNASVMIFLLVMFAFDAGRRRRHLAYFVLGLALYMAVNLFVLRYHYLNFIDRSIVDQLMAVRDVGFGPVDALQRLFSNYLPVNLVPSYFSNLRRVFELNPVLVPCALLAVFLIRRFDDKFTRILVVYFFMNVAFLVFGKSDIYMNRGYLIVLTLAAVLAAIGLKVLYDEYRAAFWSNLSGLVAVALCALFATYSSPSILGKQLYAHFNIWDGINYIPDGVTPYQAIAPRYESLRAQGYVFMSTDVPETLYYYGMRPDYYLSAIPIEAFNQDGRFYHYYDRTPYVRSYEEFREILSRQKKVVLFTGLSLDGCRWENGTKVYPEVVHIDCRISEYLRDHSGRIIFQSPYSPVSRVYLFN